MGFVTNTDKKPAAARAAVPAIAAKVAVTPEEKPAKQSAFRSLGRFALNVGKEILIAAPRALATPFATLYQDIESLRTGSRPESVKVPVLGEIGVSNDPVKGAGQLGGRVVDIGLTATGGTVAKAGVKTLAKEAVEQGVKTTVQGAVEQGAKQAVRQAARSGFRALVKAAPKDAAVGGGYGLAAGLAESPDDPYEILKSTVTGAILGTLAPPVLGVTAKVAMKGTGAASRAVGKTIDRTAKKLESRAQAAETKAAVAGMLETPGHWGGIRTNPVVKKEVGVVDKIAAGAAKVLRAAQELPDKAATAWYDKFHPVKKFQQRLKQEGFPVPDLHEEVQGAQYRGFGKAANRLDEYLALRGTYGDDWKYVKMFSRYQDDLDDLALGKAIEGGRDTTSVKADIEAMFRDLPLERREKVYEGSKLLQDFLNRELLDAVGSGRISMKQYQDIKAAHPNYIPHRVVDEMADEAVIGAGGSFQLTRSGIELREGVASRASKDVDEAVVERILQQSLLDEKNKVNLALFETVGDNFEQLGFKPLRTAANVELREEYYKALSDMQDDVAAQLKIIRELKDVDKTVVRRLEQLQKRLSDKEAKFFADLAAYGGDGQDFEASRLFARKQRDIEARNEAVRDYTLPNPEQELGYQRFKKLAQKRAWIFEPSVDAAGMKKRMKGVNLDNLIFSGAGGDATNDELLDLFRGRFKLEKGLKKPNTRIAQKVEKLQQRLSEGEDAIKVLSKEQRELAGDRPALTASISAVEDRVKQLDELKADMMQDLKNHADIKVRSKDARKDGFETYKFFRNGIREEWLVPEDLGRALKHIDAEDADAFIRFFNHSVAGKALTAPARATRFVATQRNPMFAVFANPARDVQTVAITNGLGLSIEDYAKGMRSARSGQKIADDLYRLAREEGALQGSVYREGEDATGVLRTMLRRLNQMGDTATSRTVRKVGDIVTLKAVEDAGQVMEEATRLAVFSRAIKNGVAPRQAAKMARNATVDFGKSGSWMKVVNRVIPFLNARVQGLSNLGAAIKSDPTRAMRKIMYTAAWPATVLTSWNLRFDAFKNVPDNERRKYWIVMVGQTKGEDYKGQPIEVPYYVKIPKGEAQQIASIAVERVLTAGLTKYPEATRLFMSKLLNDVSPVTESSILPPGLSQWVELKSNYSFFREKQIEGEYTKVNGKWYKTKELEAKLRSKENTSVVAKYLGKILNWSPTKIDYVVKQGLVSDFLRVGDLAFEGWIDKDAPGFQKASELPWARSIIGTSSYGEDTRRQQFEAEEKRRKNTEKIRRMEKSKKTPMLAPPPTMPVKQKAKGFVSGK